MIVGHDHNIFLKLGFLLVIVDMIIVFFLKLGFLFVIVDMIIVFASYMTALTFLRFASISEGSLLCDLSLPIVVAR